MKNLTVTVIAAVTFFTGAILSWVTYLLDKPEWITRYEVTTADSQQLISHSALQVNPFLYIFGAMAIGGLVLLAVSLIRGAKHTENKHLGGQTS
ncbi:hypothetical protein FACS1894217_02800 [Clostridia bacterium]|nr:hypothetical protein FACS1894217_02800 [Clostridia bacterium]